MDPGNVSAIISAAVGIDESLLGERDRDKSMSEVIAHLVDLERKSLLRKPHSQIG